MSDAPLMPKATAVWLVENTSLTFDQIAEFCKLHPLEVKGIADGEVATGIKGYDPISTGQLTREEIAAGEKDPNHRLQLSTSKVRMPEFKKPRGAALHAAVAPAGPAERHPVAAAQPSRAQGRADHAARRHDQADASGDPRAHPLEFGQSSADGPGDAGPVLADRPRLRGQSRRQGAPQGRRRSQPDAGPGRSHHRPAHPAPASQLEVFGVPTPKPKPTEEKIDVNSVFGKLKEKRRPTPNRRIAGLSLAPPARVFPPAAKRAAVGPRGDETSRGRCARRLSG